ncbi:MAG: acyl-CoA dehydrogenase family protein [Chloroflexi bacterium]|nr:acyl-CoA dehydrogenase family protein [Chloroflexota bacterium]MBA3851646.1 acyl-CoA dehydrogenase family protein [Chloroflexota bacterium]
MTTDLGTPGASAASTGARTVAPTGLTDEERLLRDTTREFAAREIAPGAAERDEEERYDRTIFTRMGELGLTAVPFPESVGGAGFGYRAWTLVMEEVAYADMAMAVSLSVHILAQYSVVTWGTPEQRAWWLPDMLSGEKLGAFALTEPQAGSDASSLRLRAEPVGPADAPTGYRLTGTKIWITNGIEAERYLVFATVDPSAGARGITAFLVEAGTPGFTFGRRERKLGIRSDTASELIFEGAEVPVGNRLGEEGQGYKIALSALGEGRISIAAACVGLAQSALDAAARYLTERSAFGGPLSDQQGLRFMLAEMAQKIASARALTRTAAEMKDRGENIAEASSLAKWTASDAAMSVTTDAVQLFGGSGYSREFPVERMMRDAKGAQIYEGTNQIHRLIVADHLLQRIGRQG